MLITHVLDSSNYYSWARSMRRALRIKNKLGFIDGTFCEPKDPNDPLMEYWLRYNEIVITWMQNAMAIDIKRALFMLKQLTFFGLILSNVSPREMLRAFLK